MHHMPVVYESGKQGERGYDLFSNFLKSRIVWISGDIDEVTGNIITSSILFLRQTKGDITVFINSPGGYVTEGLAIYDALKSCTGKVKTRCIGQAMSMAVPILAAGTKGERLIYPNATVMIHQPSGGIHRSTAQDIDIYTAQIKRTKERLESLLANDTNLTAGQIAEMTQRDKYLNADEAIQHGIVDGIYGLTPDEVSVVNKAKKKK